MIDFYRKILEPILPLEPDDLRRVAFILENAKPENDDNISSQARLRAAEVLNRVARLKDFADWILKD